MRTAALAATSQSGVGRAHRFVNIAILALIPLQVYLVGAAMFGAASLMPHRAAGFLLLLLSLISVILAATARRRGGRVAPPLLLLGLMILQPIFVQVFRGVPAVAALHAANTVALFAVALWIEHLAREA